MFWPPLVHQYAALVHSFCLGSGSAVPGVADAKVDLGRKTATVKFDPDKAGIATLVKATTNAGFPATVHK